MYIFLLIICEIQVMAHYASLFFVYLPQTDYVGNLKTLVLLITKKLG